MTARTPARTKAAAGVPRFRDLGPLVVERDDEAVPLVGARLVGALTLLLVQAGRVVSADALAAAIWGEGRGAAVVVHARRARVAPAQRARARPGPRRTRHRAAARTGRVAARRRARAGRFAAVRRAGRRDLAPALRRPGRPGPAAWRGGARPAARTPVRRFRRRAVGPPAVARLDELRAQVRERHVAALLAVDDPERALVELTSAIADDPLRERPWVHRMLANYRTGRTDRALATYQEARPLFRAELGIEPGGGLRALQARILAGDAAGWPRTRRRTPRWPPATSPPASCGRTAWSPGTARCGCARARACSRCAPTCSRSRATPPPPSGCTPRPGAQPARGHAVAAAPGHPRAPRPGGRRPRPCGVRRRLAGGRAPDRRGPRPAVPPSGAQARSRALRRSSTRSSTSSMPTESRTRSSGTCSAEPATDMCVIWPGCSMSDSTPASDSASVNTSVAAQTRSAASRPPRSRMETMPPKRRICLAAASCPGCSGRPG